MKFIDLQFLFPLNYKFLSHCPNSACFVNFSLQRARLWQQHMTVNSLKRQWELIIMWTSCLLACWRKYDWNWKIQKSLGMYWHFYVYFADVVSNETWWVICISNFLFSPRQIHFRFCRDLFRKRSSRKSKRRACSPLGVTTTCLSGNTNTNPSTPVGPANDAANTPPSSIQNR